MIELSVEDFAEAMKPKLDTVPALYSVQVALTYRCNVSCIHCYATGADSGGLAELTPTEMRDLFRQFADAGCLHCTVTGGEPLIRSDFEEIWTAIAEQGIRRLLFTNATLVDEKTAAFLKDLPPDWVEVTLLGADAETHDGLTRVRGSFEAALAGIRHLSNAGLCVRPKTIVMKGNLSQLGDIKKLAQTLGDGSFRLDGQLMGDFAGRIDMDALRVSPEELVVAEEAFGKDAFEVWCHEVKRLSGYKRTRLYGCGAAQRAAYLSPWGDLHPCLSATHISQSLRAMSVLQAWRMLKEDIAGCPLPENMPCIDCSAFAFCQNCPAAAKLDGAGEQGVSTYRCAVAKIREKRYNKS